VKVRRKMTAKAGPHKRKDRTRIPIRALAGLHKFPTNPGANSTN
jgi:hypothetical protein